MAQIQTVDYEAIPGQAQQMREDGKLLNTEVTTAYTSIANMHDSWYGKRYNDLVTRFNEIIPKLNEMLTLVVTDIPVALETIANNYSLADTGNTIVTVNNEGPNKITDLTISSDVGMKFISSTVEQVRGTVSTNFDNAVTQMNSIESIYNGITWQSEAANDFKARFTQLKSDIITSFENIKEAFTQLMTQAQSDIEAAESKNTVGAGE